MKKSNKRGLWQVKERVSLYYSLVGFHFLFEEAIANQGFDPKDTKTIYNLAMSESPFPGYQIKMKKKDTGTGNTDYIVEENHIGKWKNEGYLPNELFRKFDSGFAEIYLKISLAGNSAMYFLRETPID